VPEEQRVLRVVRKLAAILAADVAGYSRLMGADEVGTLRALMADLKQVVDPEIAAYRGRLVKTTGDGILVEFASAVDAVACAVAIQRAMLARNAELPEDRRLLFRTGINLGDVIVEGKDIYGDGVNVAARLEALAEPGGICISGTVHEQVRDKLPFAFTDRGEQTVKNIARPVHVYALGADAMAALTQASMAPTPAGQDRGRIGAVRYAVAGLAALAFVALALWLAFGVKWAEVTGTAPRFSIMVLPFTALGGGDPAHDYLADVITEELTTGLSRVSPFFVIARSTAMTYKGKDVDVRQIGKDLGVRYVVEGSEQHGGKKVRVNAQLISAETGAHLWADQFDADMTDLLQMQDEIVTRLARALQTKLVEIDAAHVERTRPGNLDAEDLAMRCEAALYNAKTGAAGLQTGYGLCERALQIDPRNVRALVNLSFKYIDPVLEVQSKDPESDIRQAEDLVSRALALDPNAYSAHFAKSELLLGEKRFDEAFAEAELTLSLNPSFVSAYGTLSTASSFLGRPETAIEYVDTAMRLSPRDPFMFALYLEKGFALAMLKEDQQAIEWLRRAVAEAPEWPLPRAMLASELALTGHDAEAHEELERYLALKGTTAKTLAQWKAYMPAGSPAFLAYAQRLSDGLREAGMPEE
jgi:adenylate cyclase